MEGPILWDFSPILPELEKLGELFYGSLMIFVFYLTWKDAGIVFVGSLRNSGVHGVHQKKSWPFLSRNGLGGSKLCIRLPAESCGIKSML